MLYFIFLPVRAAARHFLCSTKRLSWMWSSSVWRDTHTTWNWPYLLVGLIYSEMVVIIDWFFSPHIVRHIVKLLLRSVFESKNVASDYNISVMRSLLFVFSQPTVCTLLLRITQNCYVAWTLLCLEPWRMCCCHLSQTWHTLSSGHWLQVQFVTCRLFCGSKLFKTVTSTIT